MPKRWSPTFYGRHGATPRRLMLRAAQFRLVMLARSRAIDRLRANRARKPPSGEQPASEPVPDPAVELHQAERARIVRNALAGLDSNERAALQLAYFSDLSQSEVAEKLGIPLGTVKTRMRSAMMKLREALSGRHE